MNIMDILGGLMQAKTAPSATRRMQNVFGADGASLPSDDQKSGLGLGFFIAKTLLERTGARLVFDNAPWDDGSGATGAWIELSWPWSALAAEPMA